jgi:hypothetical protein
MTIRARAEHDFYRDSVRIQIGELHGRELRYIYSFTGEVRTVDDPTAAVPDDTGLMLREDIARAVYEALADHFGHSGHDTRALRRDYDAERARVDKLVAHLIGGER